MNTYSPHEAVDAVVIGTDAGDEPLLVRHGAAGLKVIALEAGRQLSGSMKQA